MHLSRRDGALDLLKWLALLWLAILTAAFAEKPLGQNRAAA